MRKPTLLSLITLLLFALLAPGAWRSVAAQSNNTLMIGDISATPGSSGVIPIDLQNQDTMASAELHFSYNGSIGLQITNARPTNRTQSFNVTFSQDASNPASIKVKALIFVLGTHTVASGSGPIIELLYTTTPAANGSTVLQFDPVKTKAVGPGVNTPVLPMSLDDGAVAVSGIAPTITSVQPGHGKPGETHTVTINAANTNFTAGQTQVDFGAGIQVSNINVISTNQVKVDVAINASAAPGPRTIKVTTGAEQAIKTAGFTVDNNGPAPVITNINPDSGNPGAILNVTVDAQGSNFVVGRTEASFGAGITISNVVVVSPTQAVMELQVAANAQPGERTVTLTTGAEVVSKTQGFRVNVTPPANGNATLYLDPSPASMQVGAKQTLAIMLSPGKTPVNGVQINGKVDPTVLRLTNVISGATQLSQVLAPVTFDAATGVFQFSAGVLGATIAEPFTVLTLEVEALKASAPGGTPIAFVHTHPATDISGPGGPVMEAARDGVVIVENASNSATLRGRIDFQGRPAKPHASWSAPVTVELTLQGANSPTTQLVTTDNRGEFTLSNLPVGVYQVRIKGEHTLANRIEEAPLNAGLNQVFLGTLYEGDIETQDTKNQSVLRDFGLFSGAFDKCAGDTGYQPNADLNELDDCITIEDFGLFSPNFNKQGDITYASPQSVAAPLPLPFKDAVLGFDKTRYVLPVGLQVDLPLYVDPNGGDAIVGVTAHYRFNPAEIELVDVLLTGKLSNVLLTPEIDRTQGSFRFVVSAPLGQEVNQRLQIATVRVKLKVSSPGALITPVTEGARGADVAGANGSIMARAGGVTLISPDQLVFRVYLPAMRR